MRRIIAFSLFLLPLFVGACQSEGGTPTLNTDDQKASYGIGFQIGGQLLPSDPFLDMDAFLAGLRDGMAANDPVLPVEELQAATQSFSQKVMEEQSRQMAEEAETNALDGAAFLTENAARDGVMVTESGLQYEVLREGEGAQPGPDDQVSIHYRGTLIDGTQFDSSYDSGQPLTLGVSGFIRGFSEGLQLMTVGSQYKFFIPSEIGYGPNPQGAIGPNSTLIFEVELLEIIQ